MNIISRATNIVLKALSSLTEWVLDLAIRFLQHEATPIRRNRDFLAAARAGDVTQFRRMLGTTNQHRTYDINYRDWRDRTALKWAIINNHDQIFSDLLHYVDAPEELRPFQLEIADRNGWHTKLLRFIAEFKRLVSNLHTFIGSLLSLNYLQIGIGARFFVYGTSAVINFLAQIVTFFSRVLAFQLVVLAINRIAEALIRNLKEKSAIELCVAHDRLDMFVILEAFGNNALCESNYLLAVESGSVNIVKYLLQNTSAEFPSECYEKLAKRAVFQGNEKILKLLLQSGVHALGKPSDSAFSPFHNLLNAYSRWKMARMSGNKKHFNVCLDPDRYSESEVDLALDWAMSQNYVSCIYRLLSTKQINIAKVKAYIERHVALQTESVNLDGLKKLLPETNNQANIEAALVAAVAQDMPAIAAHIQNTCASPELYSTVLPFNLLKSGLSTQPNMLNQLLNDQSLRNALVANNGKQLKDLMVYFEKNKTRTQLFFATLLPTVQSDNLEKLFSSKEFSNLLFANSGELLKYLLGSCNNATRKLILENATWNGIPIKTVLSCQSPIWMRCQLFVMSVFPRHMKYVVKLSAEQQHVLDLIIAKDAVTDYQASLMRHRQGVRNTTNASDSKFAAQGTHFLKTVKPKCIDEIKRKYGEDYFDGIEYLMKADVLSAILAAAKGTIQNARDKTPHTDVANKELQNAEKIVAFFNSLSDDEMNNLKRCTPDMLARARPLFCSNEETSHIAWRCFDREAPTHRWPNLLVEQIKTNTIYSITEVHKGALTMAEGSRLAREITTLSYYTLLKMPQDISDAELERRRALFIDHLAEIRRGNNGSSLAGTDDPSCIVGIYSRAARLWSMDPKLTLDDSVSDRCKKILTPIVLRGFKEALEECTSVDQKQNLYDALIGIRYETATDALSKMPIEELEQMVRLREAFIKRLGGQSGLRKQIRPELHKNNQEPLRLGEWVYPKLLIADIGGGWISASLTAEFVRVMPNVATQTTAHVLVNPFILSKEQIATFRAMARTSIIESRNKKAAYWDEMHPILEPHGLGEFTAGLINEIFGCIDDPDANVENITIKFFAESNKTINKEICDEISRIVMRLQATQSGGPSYAPGMLAANGAEASNQLRNASRPNSPSYR